MACTIYAIKGMGQECAGAVAGLKRILIGLSREWVVTDASTSAAPHSVTIAAAADADNPTFYDYYIMDESSSLSSTLTVNNANGVKYYNNVINATWVRMRPEKHIELMALANEKLIVIAQDNNNEYWVLGKDGFVTATEETAQTGQSFDDLSGYQVVLTHRSAALPFSISEANLPAIDTPDSYNE